MTLSGPQVPHTFRQGELEAGDYFLEVGLGINSWRPLLPIQRVVADCQHCPLEL